MGLGTFIGTIPDVRKILIADPNAGFAAFIAEALRGLGAYTVAVASTGPETISICAEFQPDLVILDVDLPECQPPALIGELRGLRPGLPMIYMPYTREDVPAGVTVEGVLTKPFFLPDLQPLLNGILGPLAEPAARAGPIALTAKPAPAPVRLIKIKLDEHSLPKVSAIVEALSHAVRGEPALLTRGAEIITIAPQTDQTAASALVEVVATARKKAGDTEVIRFEGDSEHSRYMLYSLGIGGDLALSVALRVRLPLLSVRKLVRDAAQEIATLVTE